MPNLAWAALWNAEHGLPVFPLLPRTKHGFHVALAELLPTASSTILEIAAQGQAK
jgi:hypothetical protein